MAEIAEELRSVDRGLSLEHLIVILHDQGFSIVESIWFIRHITNMSASEVKNLVSSQPVWEDIVKATEPLHDALEKIATKMATREARRNKR